MRNAGSFSRNLAAIGLLLATACTGADRLVVAPTADPAPKRETTGDPFLQDKAESVAAALLAADKAERTGDGAALARAVQQLESLGASPQNETDAAARKRWLASLPPDAAPMRGRALGPAYRSGVLDAGAATQLHQTFLGGRSAQIVLRVSRGQAPQLVVRDQSGRQVCAVDDDPMKCRWVPLYTQRHRIEIVNTGSEQSEFFLVFD